MVESPSSKLSSSLLWAILLIVFVGFSSVILGPPSPYADSFYTYALSNPTTKAIDPRNIEGAMTPEMQLEFEDDNSSYWKKTASFREDFANNYLVYRAAIMLVRWAGEPFFDNSSSDRIPLTLMLTHGLCFTLFVALLCTMAPIQLRAKLLQVLLAVFIAVFIIQFIIPAYTKYRIYTEDARYLLRALRYLLSPPMEQSPFGWATRSTAYAGIVVFLSIAVLTRNGVYTLLLIPLIHAVCGMLLLPGLAYWALTNRTTEAKIRISFIVSYISLLLCFSSAYQALLSLSEISYTKLLIYLSIMIGLLVLGIAATRRWPILQPNTIIIASIVGCTGVFLFFSFVYLLFHNEMNFWQANYFIQEFSTRSLDVLRCVLMAWAVQALMNHQSKYFGATAYSWLKFKAGMTCIVVVYALWISMPKSVASFRVYHKNYQNYSQPLNYEMYLYHLIMANK